MIMLCLHGDSIAILGFPYHHRNSIIRRLLALWITAVSNHSDLIVNGHNAAKQYGQSEIFCNEDMVATFSCLVSVVSRQDAIRCTSTVTVTLKL